MAYLWTHVSITVVIAEQKGTYGRKMRIFGQVMWWFLNEVRHRLRWLSRNGTIMVDQVIMSSLFKKSWIGSYKICHFHVKNVADVIIVICDSLSTHLNNIHMYMHESHCLLLISILYVYRSYISFIHSLVVNVLSIYQTSPSHKILMISFNASLHKVNKMKTILLLIILIDE